MEVLKSNEKNKRVKRKTIIRRSIIALILIVIVGVLVLDHWLPYMLLSHYKFSVDNNPAVLQAKKIEKEDIRVVTEDGIEISGWHLSSTAKPMATIVVLHTLGRTRADMLEFAIPFLDEGFDLVLELIAFASIYLSLLQSCIQNYTVL